MDQTLLRYLHHFASSPEIAPIVVFVAVWLIFLLFFLAIGIEFFHRDRRWTPLLAAFVSAGTGAIASSVFAFLLPMPRPFFVSPDAIIPLISVINPLGSLPSGHTATLVAFGFGLFLAGRKSGLVYLFFGILVGFARVAAGVHFPSDVLVGIVFGVVSATFVHQVFLFMNGENVSPSSVKG